MSDGWTKRGDAKPKPETYCWIMYAGENSGPWLGWYASGSFAVEQFDHHTVYVHPWHITHWCYADVPEPPAGE